MKEFEEQELLSVAEEREKSDQRNDQRELSKREWLVLIVLYPLPAPVPAAGKPNGFKRLLEVLSAVLKIAGMAYGLYQAVMGAG